jgi:lambda family phage portal protein
MLIERALLSLFPGWAKSRLQNRIAAQRLLALYDGGRLSERTGGWRSDSTGPNTEIGPALSLLRDRARDLVRNNGYASSGLEKLVSYQVGTGIVPRSMTGDETADRAANDAWAEWARHADLTRRLDVYGLQALAARSRAEAGEALALLVPLGGNQARRRGQRVPLAIQLLEADHLDVTYDEVLPGGGQIRQGVELDATGAPVGYWLNENHPGEYDISFRPGFQRRRFDAGRMVHLYRQDRPGQLRGVPDLASVMLKLRQLDDLEDATLQQAVVQACVAAFVTSDAEASKGPLEGVNSSTGSQEKVIRPGMTERLLPGEKVDFLTPSPNGQFDGLSRHQLRVIAEGFGLTYDLLTGDLSQANYSSLRAGRLAFKRRLEQAQWLMIIPRFCQPVWDAFVQAAQLVGVLPPRQGPWPVEWAAPRFEMVDPLKDTLAIEKQLRLGLTSWPQAVAEMGWDPKRQAREIADSNAEHDRLQLVFDGDPRRTGGSGQAQPAPAADPADDAEDDDMPEAASAAATPLVLNLTVDARASQANRRVDMVRNPDGSLSARMTEEP